MIGNLYIDPKKEDDMWIYIPSLRRLRRFPTSQRCATLAPTIYTHDDTWMFRGKVTKFNYRLTGEGKILSIIHQKNIPAIHKKGTVNAQDEDWEVRDVWIGEQTPKNKSYC